MDFRALNKNLPPVNPAAAAAARAKWDAIAKPLGSLGVLEDHIVRIAALTGEADVRLRRRAVLVLCADNGVVAEGVTQADSGVTMLVAESLTRRGSSVCLMAAGAGAEVFPVDMGMNARPKFTGLIDRRIADGTRNLAKEPAMTREQAEAAVLAGIGLAEDMKARGYDIVCTGEMGIGNTTTAAAVCAALLDLDPEDVAGRGSGLTDDALARKKRVIRSALALHRPDRRDVIGVLSKVGGFDIAGMAGIFIGGARCGLPVVIDGFISSVAALAAARLCPGCAGAMLASHVSGEPAGPLALRKLQLSPLITAGMRLGEGTGAVAALPLLDLALRVYHGSASFDELGMDAYEKL